MNSFQTVLHVCMTIKWALIMKKHIIREFMMGFSWYRHTNTAVQRNTPTAGWNKNKCVLSCDSRTSLVFSPHFIKLGWIESHSEPMTRFIKIWGLKQISSFCYRNVEEEMLVCWYTYDFFLYRILHSVFFTWGNSCLVFLFDSKTVNPRNIQ